MRLRAGVAATVLAAVALAIAAEPKRALVVTPQSLHAAVHRAPEGAVLRLQPGRYRPFRLARRLVVEGRRGVIVRGPLLVEADRARVRMVRVEGGESAIVVRNAEDVVIDDVRIAGAELHGIEVAESSVHIRGCRVDRLGPFGQGVEIRNGNGHARSVVENCSIAGGYEGITAHASRLELRGNRVTGTTGNALAVSEMSEALVEQNAVERVQGVAIYCGDGSHCEVRHNRVRHVRPDSGGARSRAGYAIVASYRSTIRARGNRSVAARPIGLFVGSTTTDRFPLGLWPQGWRGALPAAGAGVAALALLLVLSLAFAGVARRRRQIRGRPSPVALALVVPVLLVQGVHMLEHTVQVFQVHVADAEHRSGLLGHHVDTEWLHLGYNLLVFVLLGTLTAAVWRARFSSAGAAALLAASFVQTYHLAEHVAKVIQHVQLGLRVAPGLLGGRLGLVAFHFAINLAVTAGLVAGAAAVLRARKAPADPSAVSSPDAGVVAAPARA